MDRHQFSTHFPFMKTGKFCIVYRIQYYEYHNGEDMHCIRSFTRTVWMNQLTRMNWAFQRERVLFWTTWFIRINPTFQHYIWERGSFRMNRFTRMNQTFQSYFTYKRNRVRGSDGSIYCYCNNWLSAQNHTECPLWWSLSMLCRNTDTKGHPWEPQTPYSEKLQHQLHSERGNFPFKKANSSKRAAWWIVSF